MLLKVLLCLKLWCAPNSVILDVPFSSAKAHNLRFGEHDFAADKAWTKHCTCIYISD